MEIKELISLFVMIFLALVLLPIIGKAVLVIIGILAVLGIVLYIASLKTRKEIEKDPEKYFSSQFYNQKEKEYVDVIDAEYQEREIVDDD